MAKYDNMLKKKLKNVYFIWGSGETAVANALADKYSLYIYHTDETRNRHIRQEVPMIPEETDGEVCGEDLLDQEELKQWERDILRDLTPIVVSDLIELSEMYDVVLCEGSLDIDSIVPIATHIITISDNEDDSDFWSCSDGLQTLEEFGAKKIVWDLTVTVEDMVEEVAEYFGFSRELL